MHELEVAAIDGVTCRARKRARRAQNPLSRRPPVEDRRAGRPQKRPPLWPRMLHAPIQTRTKSLLCDDTCASCRRKPGTLQQVATSSKPQPAVAAGTSLLLMLRLARVCVRAPRGNRPTVQADGRALLALPHSRIGRAGARGGSRLARSAVATITAALRRMPRTAQHSTRAALGVGADQAVTPPPLQQHAIQLR